MGKNAQIYIDSSDISDIDGTVKFSGLPFGTYNLAEIAPPADHDPDYTIYSVVIDKDGRMSYINLQTSDDDSYIVVDEFHKGNISIQKLDVVTGEPMRGVVFVIYDKDGENRGTVVTDESGITVFTSLIINETYSVEEMTTSNYYPSRPLMVEVSEISDKNVYETVWYSHPYDGSITITKISSVSPYARLHGVSFGLYSVDDPDILIAEGVTDISGVLTFSGLPMKVLTDATSETAPPSASTPPLVSAPSLESTSRASDPTSELTASSEPVLPTDMDQPQELPAELQYIPDIADVPEEDIIHVPQLPEGHGIIKVGDDIFVIYNDSGIPLGYIILPEDVPLEEFDIMGNMIPLGKVNPKTGSWADIAGQKLWQWFILLVFAVVGFIIVGKKRGRIKKALS